MNSIPKPMDKYKPKTIQVKRITDKHCNARYNGTPIIYNEINSPLALHINSKNRTFYFTRAINGKSNRTKIGTYPETTIYDAHVFEDFKIRLGFDPEGSKDWFAVVDYENQQILMKGGWKWYRKEDVKPCPTCQRK